MNKMIAGSILLTIAALAGIAFLLKGEVRAPVANGNQANVTIVDGKQVIDISAKGGYAPRVTMAKANIPTVINVQTNGTYDCSAALTVPAVAFREILPSSGTTPVEIPPQQPGTTIKGVCSMGMYNFAVNFN